MADYGRRSRTWRASLYLDLVSKDTATLEPQAYQSYVYADDITKVTLTVALVKFILSGALNDRVDSWQMFIVRRLKLD